MHARFEQVGVSADVQPCPREIVLVAVLRCCMGLPLSVQDGIRQGILVAPLIGFRMVIGGETVGVVPRITSYEIGRFKAYAARPGRR